MSCNVPEPSLSHQAPSPTRLPSSFQSLLSDILICTQFWSEADPRFHLFLSLGREKPAARHHPSRGRVQASRALPWQIIQSTHGCASPLRKEFSQFTEKEKKCIVQGFSVSELAFTHVELLAFSSLICLQVPV